MLGLKPRLLARARMEKMPRPVVMQMLTGLKKAMMPFAPKVDVQDTHISHLLYALDGKKAVIIDSDGNMKPQRGTLELSEMTPRGTAYSYFKKNEAGHTASHHGVEFPHPHLG